MIQLDADLCDNDGLGHPAVMQRELEAAGCSDSPTVDRSGSWRSTSPVDSALKDKFLTAAGSGAPRLRDDVGMTAATEVPPYH